MTREYFPMTPPELPTSYAFFVVSFDETEHGQELPENVERIGVDYLMEKDHRTYYCSAYHPMTEVTPIRCWIETSNGHPIESQENAQELDDLADAWLRTTVNHTYYLPFVDLEKLARQPEIRTWSHDAVMEEFHPADLHDASPEETRDLIREMAWELAEESFRTNEGMTGKR